MRRLCVARWLRAWFLIFLVAGQVLLELIAMAAARIVHRAVLISPIGIGGWRILRVTVSIAFLIGILIGSHCGLLARAARLAGWRRGR
jgi:hypothetical protein